MPSQVQIINQALFAIGAQASLQAIPDPNGTPQGVGAALIYQQTIDNLSRSAHWNCLRRQASLTLLKAAAGTPENPNGMGPKPQVPWLYCYAYPEDCLAARYILPFVPSTQVNPPLTTAAPIPLPPIVPLADVPYLVGVDFDADGNEIRVINTNLCQAILVYTARVKNPNLWDPHFIQAAISYLAAWFVPGLSQNFNLQKMQLQIAQSVVAQARVSDGNEGVATQDHEPDWLRIRNAIGWCQGGNFCGRWDNLALPGGGFF